MYQSSQKSRTNPAIRQRPTLKLLLPWSPSWYQGVAHQRMSLQSVAVINMGFAPHKVMWLLSHDDLLPPSGPNTGTSCSDSTSLYHTDFISK